MKKFLTDVVGIFFKSASRTAGSVQTRKALNHGDTRWECEGCGSIKPKVAKKFDTEEGIICLKCKKALDKETEPV